jgi:transcriptional regulator with XRE-family HTH domain
MGMSMLTGVQVRAARTSLRWTVQELAGSAGVSVSTIKRVEADDGVPSISARNLLRIKSALEAAGIEFIGTPDDAPGIRIHRRQPD